MSKLLDHTLTQAEFGELVGLSQPAVSDLISRGVLTPGATAGAWLREYAGHLREVAAGRKSEGGGDLVAERTRLAKEQADSVALKNAQARKELAPVGVIQEVLASTAAKINVIFEGLSGSLRRRFPELSAEQIDHVSREIARVRNIVAEMQIDDVIGEDGEGDSGRGESVEVAV